MNAVLLLFWIIALTKSTDCQEVEGECSSEAGPDALRLTKGLTLVYKDRDVHQLIGQTLEKLPIISMTRDIGTEFSLQFGDTIGAVLGTAKPKYYCSVGNLKAPVVCDGHVKHRNCDTFKFPNKPIAVTHVSATSLAGDNIFVAFMDHEGYEYQAIVNARHYVLHIKKLDRKMADDRKQNPTVVEALNELKNPGDYACLVFFGPIYGFQDEDLNSLTKPVVVKKTVDYQLSNTWLACDPEVCFDARMDFTYNDQRFLMMGRGQSRWRIRLGTVIEPATRPQENWTADAATIYRNFMLISKDRLTTITTLQSETNNSTSSLFNITQSFIDAAFTLDTSSVCLISGTQVDIYSDRGVINGFPDFKHNRTTSLSTLFNILEDTIDAAVEIDQRTVYLLRKNHYYSHNVETKITSPPMLIQNNLFTCKDSFYSSSKASKMLDITNFEQFKQYRLQFAPNSATPTIYTRLFKASRIPRKVVVMFIIALILLFIAFIMCILTASGCAETMKARFSAPKGEVFTADYNPDSNEESTDLNSVKPSTDSVQ
ncbi:hypothetical protein HDE_00247 [Halotydeus destructor]|nr:hypothetical protein HDE_00247 [Halotydeus destructor]